MHRPTMIAGCTAAVLMWFSTSAFAFECPRHFEAAQAAIDKVAADMKGMDKTMDQRDMALVHAMLDDAKALLTAARHNHEKPQGAYDHARSMAKADSALGYAKAADALHFKYMQK